MQGVPGAENRLRLSNLWTQKPKKSPFRGVPALYSAYILLIKWFMTHRLLIGMCWILTALAVRAGTVTLDSLTVGSTTYSNVTVFGANTTDLFFSSDQGMSNVKLKFLSPELQKRFNY